MAVVDIYSDANLAAGKMGNPANTRGVPELRAISTITVGATDSATSVYRILKGISPLLIPVTAVMYNDAIGTAAAIDFGVWFEGVGGLEAASGSGALFDSAFSVVSANTTPVNLLTALTSSNRGQRILELLSLTSFTERGGYDVAVRLNHAGTGGGKIVILSSWIQG